MTGIHSAYGFQYDNKGLCGYNPDAKPFEVIRRDSTAATPMAISDIPRFDFQLASFDLKDLQLIGSIPLPLPQMPLPRTNESDLIVKYAALEAAKEEALRLCYAVEKLGCGKEQTDAAVAASALHTAIDKILNPQRYV